MTINTKRIIEALERQVFALEKYWMLVGSTDSKQMFSEDAEALQLVLEMFKRGPAKWDVIDPHNVGYTTDDDPRQECSQQWLDESVITPLYALPEKVK